MSKLTWAEESLPTLGLIYLRNVLDNMRNDQSATVQLGTTGTGFKPHYQITHPSAAKEPKRQFNGLNHKRYKDVVAFDHDNLSEPFTLDQIENAYQSCR